MIHEQRWTGCSWTHLCLCLPCLRFTSCDRHGFICLCFSSLPPASPPPCKPPHRHTHTHTHELKQLPWQWPSVVIIYSLFTHSCWWHFSNTGIVHCVWECGWKRDRKRYRVRVTESEKKKVQREGKKEWENIGGIIIQREKCSMKCQFCTPGSYGDCSLLIKGIGKIAARSFMRALFPWQFAMFGSCTANLTDSDLILLLGRHY